MIILAIETSCDETGVAIVENTKVLSNITISQILKHSDFGGVLPSLAAKLHIKNIYSVAKKALEESGKSVKDLEYIAYTSEPGLIICLQIGKIFAETLGLFLNIPVVPCNHLWGHAYASLIDHHQTTEWKFPALALIISGGHTQFWKISDYYNLKVIGETLDDAIGECLDKTAVIIGEKYPGGAVIEKIAMSGEITYNLPFPKNDKSLDFSFSGLKSEIRRISIKEDAKLNVQNLCASLQSKLAEILTKKMNLALNYLKPKTVIIGGGVIANKTFRSKLLEVIENFSHNIKVMLPDEKYCGDNAAMIGVTAYFRLRDRKAT